MIDPAGVAKEVGAVTRSFFSVLKEQPLSLALVIMNFVLLVFLFYNGAQTNTMRNETVKMIISWQQATDTLMANCVSKDVLDSVVDALQQQLMEMRKELKNGKELLLPEAVPDPALPVPA